jgi:hypothetical protein
VFETIKSALKETASATRTENQPKSGDILLAKQISKTPEGLTIETKSLQANVKMASMEANKLIQQAQSKQIALLLAKEGTTTKLVISDIKDPKLAVMAQQVKVAQTNTQQQGVQSSANQSTRPTDSSILANKPQANQTAADSKQQIIVKRKDVQILKATHQENNQQPANVKRALNQEAKIEKLVQAVIKLSPNASMQTIESKIRGFFNNSNQSNVLKTTSLPENQLQKLASIQGLPNQLQNHAQKLTTILSQPIINAEQNYLHSVSQFSLQLKNQHVSLQNLISKLDSLIPIELIEKFQKPNLSHSEMKQLYRQVLDAVQQSKVSLHPSLKLMVEQVQVQLVKSEAQLSIFKELQSMQPQQKQSVHRNNSVAQALPDKSTQSPVNKIHESTQDKTRQITKILANLDGKLTWPKLQQALISGNALQVIQKQSQIVSEILRVIL